MRTRIFPPKNIAMANYEGYSQEFALTDEQIRRVTMIEGKNRMLTIGDTKELQILVENGEPNAS